MSLELDEPTDVLQISIDLDEKHYTIFKEQEPLGYYQPSIQSSNYDNTLFMGDLLAQDPLAFDFGNDIAKARRNYEKLF